MKNKNYDKTHEMESLYIRVSKAKGGEKVTWCGEANKIMEVG